MTFRVMNSVKNDAFYLAVRTGNYNIFNPKAGAGFIKFSVATQEIGEEPIGLLYAEVMEDLDWTTRFDSLLSDIYPIISYNFFCCDVMVHEDKVKFQYDF